MLPDCSGADESWLAHWLVGMASTIMLTFKKTNVGITVACSTATCPRHAVNKEAWFQYGKIHARGDVMSYFASSLTWDGDCKTNFVSLCTAVHTLPIQGLKMPTCCQTDGMVDLIFDPMRICSFDFCDRIKAVQYSTNLMRSFCVSSVLHDDVNDAHFAGANRLQTKTNTATVSNGPGSSVDHRNIRRRLDTFSFPDGENCSKCRQFFHM